MTINTTPTTTTTRTMYVCEEVHVSVKYVCVLVKEACVSVKYVCVLVKEACVSVEVRA